jgi:hypothetical protein
MLSLTIMICHADVRQGTIDSATCPFKVEMLSERGVSSPVLLVPNACNSCPEATYFELLASNQTLAGTVQKKMNLSTISLHGRGKNTTESPHRTRANGCERMGQLSSSDMEQLFFGGEGRDDEQIATVREFMAPKGRIMVGLYRIYAD